ncbi:MAG: hypothetical protein WC773_03620 [Patescibacteria group bacterium]
MSDDMLGKVVKKLAKVPEMWGLIDDLLTKIENPDMLAAIKQCLRGSNPWPRTRRELLQACANAGISLFGGSVESADHEGQQLPIRGDLPELLRDFDEVLRLQEQGKSPVDPILGQPDDDNCRLLSVEETLVVILAWFRKNKRAPDRVVYLRCRNTCGRGFSLLVYWGPDDGLCVRWYGNGNRVSDAGGLLRA